jgi:prepilin-type N-terminal cleavage/methylation domain-containing protein
MQDRHAAALRAFTLIELLTVVAIIALLIGILMPSLSGARDAAKKTKSLAHIKAISGGLEAFRDENSRDIKGGGYPPSEGQDDPTEDNWKPFPDLYGAQWAVRYLLGKRLDGYISPRTVPKRFWNKTDENWIQKGWYDTPGTGESPLTDPNSEPFERTRYVDPQIAPVKTLRDIPGAENAAMYDPNAPEFRHPAFIDGFGYPILYYAANAKMAALENPPIARDHDPFNAIYDFGDNAIFTTGCTKGGCIHKPWDFGGGVAHYTYPVQWRGYSPPDWSEVLPPNPNAFPNYIMDRQAYDATNGKTIAPVRRDSFILLSPGRDALIGTPDDPRNF